jgi:hypothetical protein
MRIRDIILFVIGGIIALVGQYIWKNTSILFQPIWYMSQWFRCRKREKQTEVDGGMLIPPEFKNGLLAASLESRIIDFYGTEDGRVIDKMEPTSISMPFLDHKSMVGRPIMWGFGQQGKPISWAIDAGTD